MLCFFVFEESKVLAVRSNSRRHSAFVRAVALGLCLSLALIGAIRVLALLGVEFL